jgi:uncharacterized glyoxalase superfamily protein PhnB
MKINAIGVFTSNLAKTVEFYSLVGFKFPEFKSDEQHLEATTAPGETRLMIDSKELIKSLIGEEPRPGNCSVFAVEFSSTEELDGVAKKVAESGFKIFKEPWDAFWGQRYCVVEDPDGHRIDLYASLPK